MDTRAPSSPFGPGQILVLAGAAMAAIGAFLPWGRLTIGPASDSAAGIHGWEGKTIVILAVGMVVRAIITARSDRRLGPLIVIGGLAIAGIAGYTLLVMNHEIINDGIAELQKSTHATPEAIRALIDSMMAAGTITIKPEIGIYLCIVGGAVGAAGGFVAHTRSGSAVLVPADRGPMSAGNGPSIGVQAGPWITGPVQPPAGAPKESAADWQMPIPRSEPEAEAQDPRAQEGVPWRTIAVPRRPPAAETPAES